MTEVVEMVICIACDQPAPIGKDEHYHCRCGAWGSVEGMARHLGLLEPEPPPLVEHDHGHGGGGSAWTHQAVASLLHMLNRIAHACERTAGALEAPPVAGFRVSITAQRKDSSMAPILVTVPPVTTDTNFNLSIVVVPVSAAGTPLPDTLTWSVSDPSIASIVPGPDTLTATVTILAAGGCTITFTDPAGNVGNIAVTVADAITGFNVTVTQNPK